MLTYKLSSTYKLNEVNLNINLCSQIEEDTLNIHTHVFFKNRNTYTLIIKKWTPMRRYSECMNSPQTLMNMWKSTNEITF